MNRRVCHVLVEILQRAGYSLDIDNATDNQILAALSDYSAKRDEMLEYILLEEYT